MPKASANSRAQDPHAASIHLRLDFGGERSLGPGKVRLLELIDETGSISAAGRALEMSYRQAWLLVDELNRMFRDPVVSAQTGGGGGWATNAATAAGYQKSKEGQMLTEAFVIAYNSLIDQKAAIELAPAIAGPAAPAAHRAARTASPALRADGSSAMLIDCQTCSGRGHAPSFAPANP